MIRALTPLATWLSLLCPRRVLGTCVRVCAARSLGLLRLSGGSSSRRRKGGETRRLRRATRRRDKPRENAKAEGE